MNPIAVPTLDAIIAEPESLTELPRRIVFQLHLKALSAVHICALALVAERLTTTETLSTEEAARLLGVAPSTLRHGAQTMYKALRVENGTRRLAWSREKVEKFREQ